MAIVHLHALLVAVHWIWVRAGDQLWILQLHVCMPYFRWTWFSKMVPKFAQHGNYLAIAFVLISCGILWCNGV